MQHDIQTGNRGCELDRSLVASLIAASPIDADAGPTYRIIEILGP
jgi:hypothetical protein